MSEQRADDRQERRVLRRRWPTAAEICDRMTRTKTKAPKEMLLTPEEEEHLDDSIRRDK